MDSKLEQFNLSKQWYINHTDFKDWTRYFYLLKTIQQQNPGTILEIGAGNHVLKNCTNHPNYLTMDLNKNLNPDFLCDIRDFQLGLQNRIDCIVCTEVLEHIPFEDVPKAVYNLLLYLRENGRVLIMIPYKKPYAAISTPINPTPFTITIPKFRNLKVTDPYHYWEIGLEGIKIKDIETIYRNLGAKIMQYKYIPYHAYWILGT